MKDISALPDIQLSADARGLTLQKVGINKIEVPIRLRQRDGQFQSVLAEAKLSVQLAKEFKGTHMSRFVSLLSTWSTEHDFDCNLEPLVREVARTLQSPAAELEIDFRYFMMRTAPVSGLPAAMAYGCSFFCSYNSEDKDRPFRSEVRLRIPISTLCPCSKEISDYGAHNQRAEIRASLLLDPQALEKPVYPETLIETLESCSSCPVYPLLKRIDEKHVTEKQYENPKFVEDVARDAILILRAMPEIAGFSLEVEALESIHAHNAFAAHTENYL